MKLVLTKEARVPRMKEGAERPYYELIAEVKEEADTPEAIEQLLDKWIEEGQQIHSGEKEPGEISTFRFVCHIRDYSPPIRAYLGEEPFKSFLDVKSFIRFVQLNKDELIEIEKIAKDLRNAIHVSFNQMIKQENMDKLRWLKKTALSDIPVFVDKILEDAAYEKENLERRALRRYL
ncbi:hypothetical protein [Anaerotardibacter muris]|uniref:hypothetical protein n=1 Tax=Anaerotardibacter muris TaxID=2941505 RepID=UPI00203A67DD|nr:hypothetical protein [Anaerotardibacter muris]